MEGPQVDAIISVIVIVVLVLIGGGLKKFKDVLGEEVPAEQKPRADYEASPEEIREFLRGMSAARPPEVAPSARPEAALEQAPAPVREAVDLGEPLATPLPATAVAPPGPVREGRARVAQPRPPRQVSTARAPRKSKVGALQQAPAAPPELPKGHKVPPAAVKAAAGMPVAFGSLSLKQAVIWSEVLGAPLGVRRRRQAARRQGPPSESQAS